MRNEDHINTVEIWEGEVQEDGHTYEDGILLITVVWMAMSL